MGNEDSVPLCLLDSGLNEAKQKAALCEDLLESGTVPAIYLAKSAAFALGKPTALVLDIGAESASVIPVSDGFALGTSTSAVASSSPAMRSCIDAGEWLDGKFEVLLSSFSYSPTIPYLIQSNVPVKAGEQPNVVLKAESTAFPSSVIDFHRAAIIKDFKESTLVVAESQAASQDSAKGLKSFEFPDGFNSIFQVFPNGEAIWQGEEQNSLPGLGELVHRSLSACDVDLRGHLASNIVVAGGGSLVNGLVERLGLELSRWYSRWNENSLLGLVAVF
jgi:actin-related protein 4